MPAISLRGGLDRDILQIVKKLEDDGMKKPTVWKVYEAIQQSNSSLRRQKKKILEDSIDRVVEFRKQEANEDDSDAELEAAMAKSAVVAEERFLLNKQMTKLWQVNSTPAGKPASEEPEASKSTKKRKRDDEGARNGAKSDTDLPGPVNQSDNVKPGLPKKARNKPYTIETPVREPPLGGVDAIRSDLQKVLKCSMHSHETFPQGHFGKDNGIMVIGNAGAGKKTLIQAIAASLGRPLVQLQDRCFRDPDKVEKNLGDALDEARGLAPCIVLIDGIHRHMSRPSKSSQGDLHGRCVAEFRQFMNRVAAHSLDGPPILIVATTTQVEDIDPHALTLFKRTVRIPLPDRTARDEILRVAAQNLALDEGFDFSSHARSTHGFVARELDQVLVNAVTALGIRRLEENEKRLERGDAPVSGPLVVTNEALATSISDHIPQTRQEGFSTIPNTTWSEVGALLDVRRHLEQLIVEPIRNPGRYVHWGIGRSAGVLLYGPPGCGKTLLAKAVSNEAQAAFISISGPELLNKYVGESERAVRELFTRARAAAPCIVFFDEMESLVPNRQSSSTDAGVRVVNTLLTELDGMKERTGVYVIGTTNRPDMIDPAILRPGRLETKILVDLPDEDERVDILRAIVRTRIRKVSEPDMACLEQVARDKRCTGFSGADLMGLYKEAAMHVLSGGRDIPAPSDARMVDDGAWDYALQRQRPSVKNPEEYRALAKHMS